MGHNQSRQSDAACLEIPWVSVSLLVGCVRCWLYFVRHTLVSFPVLSIPSRKLLRGTGSSAGEGGLHETR
jgi:hypothetical protein